MAPMFENLFDHTSIPLLNQVSAFTQARHRLILSNIANAETPGYRAQDLPEAAFNQKLREAVAAQARGADGALAQRLDLDPKPSGGPPGPDGNTVNLETEMIGLIQNTLRHNTALELMRKQFALIETAIRERV